MKKTLQSYVCLSLQKYPLKKMNLLLFDHLLSWVYGGKRKKRDGDKIS